MYASFLIYIKYYRKFIFDNFCHLYSLNKRCDGEVDGNDVLFSLFAKRTALECWNIFFLL